MHVPYRLGYSNQESVYYQAWQLILPRVDGPTSNAYMRQRSRRASLAERAGESNNVVLALLPLASGCT